MFIHFWYLPCLQDLQISVSWKLLSLHCCFPSSQQGMLLYGSNSLPVIGRNVSSSVKKAQKTFPAQSGTDLFLERCCSNKRPNWLSKAEYSYLSPLCFASASSSLRAGCPILPIFPILVLATEPSAKKNPHAAIVERPACLQAGRNSDPWVASLYS